MYLDDLYPINISGVDRGKYSELVKGGVDVTALITYKTPCVVNGQPSTVSPVIGAGVACNKIFLWPFMQTIKA